jgi:hypothetical protein
LLYGRKKLKTAVIPVDWDPSAIGNGIHSEKFNMMTRNGLHYSAEESVHSEVHGRQNSKEFKTERNGIPRKKLVLQNSNKWFVGTSKVIFSANIFEICGYRVFLWGEGAILLVTESQAFCPVL